MLTIEKIEGNSRIGVPVFSYAGRKSNNKFLIFQPTYEEKREILDRNKQEDPMEKHLQNYREVAEYVKSEHVRKWFS